MSRVDFDCCSVKFICCIDVLFDHPLRFVSHFIYVPRKSQCTNEMVAAMLHVDPQRLCHLISIFEFIGVVVDVNSSRTNFTWTNQHLSKIKHSLRLEYIRFVQHRFVQTDPLGDGIPSASCGPEYPPADRKVYARSLVEMFMSTETRIVSWCDAVRWIMGKPIRTAEDTDSMMRQKYRSKR